ncbi:transmembrane protein 186 [Pipistrellus kuhlii]|uniref:transmembrane protein 186 n=1 Tax=Pipistrellus kuhlii TaxID=59472 RepID=UPI00174F0EBD|nr:transmembrane protein 186 [Pipistrellus kuhlii]
MSPDPKPPPDRARQHLEPGAPDFRASLRAAGHVGRRRSHAHQAWGRRQLFHPDYRSQNAMLRTCDPEAPAGHDSLSTHPESGPSVPLRALKPHLRQYVPNPHLEDEETGSERWSSLPQDPQLATLGVRIGTQIWLQNRTHLPGHYPRGGTAALLRAVPRLPGLAVCRRPLYGLQCCSGQDFRRWLGSRSPTLKETPPGTETEKFQMIYRFEAIRAFGYVSKLKVAQTALTVVALPPGFYWYSQGLMTYNDLCLMGGIAGFALAMLYWMSYFFRRLVGILYVNESGTTLRVAHLTFWGWRQDSYCPVAEVIPMSDTQDRPQEIFVRIQQYSGKQTFYLTLRYGRILDRERFTQVFGSLDALK